MFNVKRNGSTVEVTQIPHEVPVSIFKDIATQTEANECLIRFFKGNDNYEVIIRHENANMAGTAAWLATEVGMQDEGDTCAKGITCKMTISLNNDDNQNIKHPIEFWKFVKTFADSQIAGIANCVSGGKSLAKLHYNGVALLERQVQLESSHVTARNVALALGFDISQC
ncbi:hypothetical protein M8A54_000362 [Salmonella enterica]|nr:hypothetical protein [Salmonella enterica]